VKAGPDIAQVAALIGDPARANMLAALMGGQALTARELAEEAGVTPQTASGHLARLEAGGLLVARKQGRHKYLALASDEVAAVLEALMGLAVASGHQRTRTGPKEGALREARVCYNHLAGERGVRMFDSLNARGLIIATDADVRLTDQGADFAETFGIALAPLQKARAPLCRACLDWSVRRSHLAGSLGRAFLTLMIEDGWAKRETEGRAIRFTRKGDKAFEAAFPL
jgi:DNA-binding transcriptional ArsR family regulator/predicted transcriptional regulator